MKVRYIVPVGTRAWLRVYWDTYAGGNGLNTCRGTNIHNAMKLIGDELVPQNDSKLGGSVEDHGDGDWPTSCEVCGAPVPAIAPSTFSWPKPDGVELHRQVFRKTMHGTLDGSWRGMPQVGDMYFADWYGCAEREGRCVHGWTNCDGRHLIVQLPGSEHHWWDVDGRASNCTMKDDTVHRCWVRHGDPVNGIVHVDKAGLTCLAGAGSIQSREYHGFLHNGDLHPC